MVNLGSGFCGFWVGGISGSCVMIGMSVAGGCVWWCSCLVVGLRLIVTLVLVYKLWLCVFGWWVLRF